MSQEKRVLWAVFEPDTLPATDDLRAQFSTSYPAFAEMEAVEYKCWWVDQERGQWGAFYVFRSQAELEAYISSERWTRLVPEKYGCTPTWRVLEPGPILSKALISQAEGSWQS